MSAAPSLPPDYHSPEEPPRIPPRHRWTWKRVTAWIGASLALLVVLLVVAVVVLLHSQSFHQYVLRTAQQKASTALGSAVHIRDFALRFSGISPALDVYDVVVEGASPYPNPPLLTVEHAHASVRVVSLLGRKWYLDDVAVNHPVAHVFVDQHGGNNLPQPKNNQSQSNTSIFDLGVRHAMLDRGEVYYNDRKTALSADLQQVNFQSAFNTADRSYSGTLSYRDGHLQMENFNPLPHDMDAQFVATPDRFTLQRAVLKSGPSQFLLTATVDDYAHPQIQARYDATIDAGQFRRVLNNPTVPSGVIRAAGTLNYVTQPNRPMLETMRLDGDLGSAMLHVITPQFRGDIRDIGARYSLNNGNVDVRDIRARLLGGELTGTLTMRNITGASRSQLRAALHGVSLAELKSLMTSPALKQVALTGTVNADAEAAWGKTMNDLVARTDASLNARLSANTKGVTTTGAQETVPLDGVIHARYAAGAKQLGLTDSYVRTPSTSIDLNGTVSTRSALQVRMRSTDLHELETLADIFRTPTPGQPVQPLGLYGQANFNGAVRGTTAAPQVTGQLTATNLRLKDTAWKLLRANVNASPSSFVLQNGQLQPAAKGSLTFNLRAGLRNYSFTNTSPFNVTLHASQLNMADLAKAAGSQTPVTGTLSADVTAHGSELNPIGQGTVNLTQAKVAGETIQSANVRFQGTGDAVHTNASVRMPAGVANAVVTYFPKQQGYDGQITANGIRLDQLHAVKARNMKITGVVNLNASGRGTLRDPALTASVTVPQLQVQDHTISQVSLQANVANHVANVALDSQLVDTAIRGRGTVNLTGDYYTNATLDTQAIPLQPLVAAYAPAQAPNITGQTELHATVRGPLKNKNLLDAHVTIPVLNVQYKNTVQIGAPQPIRIDFTNGVVQLQRATLRGTGTDLQFQGSVPINSNAPASLLVLGTVDLRLAQMLNPDITSSGQVRFDINSYGQRTDPNVEGKVQIINATFATAEAPIGLQNGNGVLTLTKDRLNIDTFNGTVGGGNVSARGGINYRPSLQFDMALAGHGIRLLYPDGVRTGLDLNMTLTGTTDASALRGAIRVDQLSFTPDFDLMSFMGQFGGVSSPPPAQGFSNNLQLDLAVQSTSGINLVSRTLSVQGAMNLRVRGTAAEPVVLGRVNLNGGDLIFNGNRYLLQGGTIDFVNPTRTQPVVNVSVNTTIQQYNILMHFQGPVDHLRTAYTSDPALPPSDIIHLLAFGSTQESAAANPNPPGNLGAESLVASAVSSQVTSRVEKIAGISQLSVDPLRGCNQQAQGACVSVQQRVTGKLFVTFSTDVTSTQRDSVQLEYQATPRVSFSATRDQNGGFGFDTRIHKVW